ncbi:MAG TPA: hypothetical protein VG621_02300 [Candidatus Paceibacterota bacterium]|nr:hypothetical protein [Candidatus Paceibacterota bacterium]
MLRTIIAIIVLTAAVVWTPIWIQMTLFAVAIMLVRYRLLLVIPALVSDVLYAPTTSLDISHFKLTGIVVVCLLVWYGVATQTRLINS